MGVAIAFAPGETALHLKQIGIDLRGSLLRR
jgi:hypothetical protein